MYDENAGASLVVVEHGAEWQCPDSADALEPFGRVMVVQQPTETPYELSLRVRRRVQLLVQSGTPVTLGVVAVCDACDDQTFQSRCQISRALLKAMDGNESPRLIFNAPRLISDAGRHELLAIAGTLMTQLHGSPMEVSVRFPHVGGNNVAELQPQLPALARAQSGLHRIERALDVA